MDLSSGQTKPIFKWLLQFDGGSRGNPGSGGSGAVLYFNSGYFPGISETLDEKWHMYNFLGDKDVTNNMAEYSGLIDGLTQAVAMKLDSLKIQGDSQLVIRQLQGTYKVGALHLKPLHAEAVRLLAKIPTYCLEHIPRDLNSRADELSNIAMDSMQTRAVRIHRDGSGQVVVWPPVVIFDKKIDE
jgi:ribonuclease HI